MEKRKSRILKVSLILLVALLACTIVARSVYTMLLPQVSIYVLRQDNLSYESTFYGVVGQLTDAEELLARDSWTITEVYVEEGDKVEAGDAILRVDISSYQIQLKQLDASIQQQSNNLDAYNWTGGDRAVLLTELEATRMQRTALLAKYPQNGIITAPSSGTVAEVVKPGVVYNGQVLMSLQGQSSSYSVPVYLDFEDIERLLTATSPSGTVQMLNSTKPIEVDVSLDGYEYDMEAASYRADFTIHTDLTLDTGMPATIRVKNFSPESTVVPLGSVYTDANGNTVVYAISETTGMFGLEYYVEAVPVSEIESNYSLTSIEVSGFVNRIAVYPSKPLADGMEVRID